MQKILNILLFLAKLGGMLFKKKQARDFINNILDDSIDIVKKVIGVLESETTDFFLNLTKTEKDDELRDRIVRFLVTAVNKMELMDFLLEKGENSLSNEELVNRLFIFLKDQPKPMRDAILAKAASVNVKELTGKGKDAISSVDADTLVQLRYFTKKRA